ncbi:MAG TPA: metalloregulator ArsR/SmtB family transcription factor [Actinomycetes bacterium]|nr:metalloregulator ArsR/SmtB family transcription factor [Actinomycetes bacterium]
MDPVQVIAEPRRREILRLIWDAERQAGEIAEHFDVTFGAVSQHLGVLRRAGVVLVRRDGTRRYYRANRPVLAPFEAMLEQMWGGQLDRLAELAERAEAGQRQPGKRAPAGKRDAARGRAQIGQPAKVGTLDAASGRAQPGKRAHAADHASAGIRTGPAKPPDRTAQEEPP